MSENNMEKTTNSNENKPKGGLTILCFLAVLIVFVIALSSKITGEPFFKMEPYNPSNYASSIEPQTIPDDVTYVGNTLFYYGEYGQK